MNVYQSINDFSKHFQILILLNLVPSEMHFNFILIIRLVKKPYHMWFFERNRNKDDPQRAHSIIQMHIHKLLHSLNITELIKYVDSFSFENMTFLISVKLLLISFTRSMSI